MNQNTLANPTLSQRPGAYLGEPTQPQTPSDVLMQQAPSSQKLPNPYTNPVPVPDTKPVSVFEMSGEVGAIPTQNKKTIPKKTIMKPLTLKNGSKEDYESFAGKGPKKGLFQQKAEKSGIVKDGSVIDQNQLNVYAIKRASDLTKNIASMGEKVDEERLNQIYDTTLGSIGVKKGTPEYQQALASIQGAYLDSAKKAGFNTIEESLNSLNTKYNELGKLKTMNSIQIGRDMSKLTDEQKAYLEQNNPVEYAKAKAKEENKQKASNYNQIIATVAPKETKKTAVTSFDGQTKDADLIEAEKAVTQWDEQINKLASEIDPETLKKSIQSQFKYTLSEGALDSLYYVEAQAKSNKIKELQANKQSAMDNYELVMKRKEVQRQRDNDITSQLMANGAMGLGATSFKDIDDMVRSGQLSTEGANILKKQGMGLLQNTIQDLERTSGQNISGGDKTQFEVMYKAGATPQQIINKMNEKYPGLFSKQVAYSMFQGANGEQYMVNPYDPTDITQVAPGQYVKGMPVGAGTGFQQGVGVSDSTTPEKANSFINFANSMVGTKYVRGGESKKGIDCSGLFVKYAKENGIPLPNGKTDITAQGIYADAKKKPIDSLQTGDALYWSKGGKITHIAYVGQNHGNGRFTIMDSSVDGGGVSERSIQLKRDKDGNRTRPGGFVIKGGDNFATRASMAESILQKTKDITQYAINQKGQVPSKYVNTKGKKILVPSEASNLASLGSIIPLIKRIQDGINAEEYSSGPIMGRVGLADPTADKTKAMQSLILQGVKIIGGFLEGGKLADKDQATYEEILPKITDRPEVAKAKLDTLKKTVIDYYNGRLDELSSNFDVSDYNSKDLSVFGGTTQPSTTQKPLRSRTTYR